MDTQTAAGDAKHSILTAFPLEILLHVTYYLTTPEYCNLRLTCKQLETTLFNAFSREFFTKRQFMFTEFSLQALVDISKSRFSSTLRDVIFGLERPTMIIPPSSFPPIGVMALNSNLSMGVRNNRQLQEYLDHMTLLNTGQDVEMLADAFSHLQNLETVGMRDFNSRSRRRDYPHNEWRSYGVRTYQEETGVHLGVLRHMNGFPVPTFTDHANYLSRVFINIIRGLGKASSHPKDFLVILRHSSLHDHAFHLPKYVESLAGPVLANLRTLFLDLNWNFPTIQVDFNNTEVVCPSYYLRKLLSKMTQLEHLRLNFEFHPGHETNDVLSWLSRPAANPISNSTPGTLLPESPPPVDFTKLTKLDIGMVTIEPKFLLAIIQKYQASLRVISCHKVSLLQADSAQSDTRINLWAQLFGQLSKLNLNLSSINMSFLSQEQAGKQHVRPVTFKDTRDPKTKRWAGTNSQSGLRDFMDLVVVDGLDHDTESSHSDESDEDGSDDSMDDANSDSEDDG